MYTSVLLWKHMSDTCTALWLYWLALMYGKSPLFQEPPLWQRKFLRLSVLSFPYLEHGNCNGTYLMKELWGINELIYLKCSKHYWLLTRIIQVLTAMQACSVLLSQFSSLPLYTYRTHTHTITNMFQNTGEAPKSGTLTFVPQEPLYTPVSPFQSSLRPRRLTSANNTTQLTATLA